MFPLVRVATWECDVERLTAESMKILVRSDPSEFMVRWRESIANMAAAGVDEFVELGGKVLGPMVKRIAPDAKMTSVVTIEDIEALAKEIA